MVQKFPFTENWAQKSNSNTLPWKIHWRIWKGHQKLQDQQDSNNQVYFAELYSNEFVWAVSQVMSVTSL